MLEFIVYFGVIIVCAVIAVIYLYPRSRKVTSVPGLDASDDYLGNFPDIDTVGSLPKFLTLLHKNYGDIASFWFGQQLVVSIASPELFKEHAKVFDRPKILFKEFEPFLGSDSIQYCNGQEGRQRHTMYGRCYSDQAMKAYYITFNELADKVVQKLSDTPREEHVGLWETMMELSMSAMLQCSLQKNHTDSVISDLRRSYDLVWSKMTTRQTNTNTGADVEIDEAFKKAKDTLTAILHQVIGDYKNNMPDDVSTTLIDTLARSDMSKSKVADDMLTVFTGGSHTSGKLMLWTFYYLVTHPDVEQKLVNEIRHILGVDESGNQGRVTVENIDNLVYLRQVLDETLRCSTLAPYAARYQDVDSELGGHRIPAGTPVIHALGVASQIEKIYPNPTKFDPERFSPENRKMLPPFAFEPFGFAGKRKCLGWKFSLTEVTVIVAAVIGHFKLSLVPDQELNRTPGLAIKPSIEIWVTVTKRD